MCMQQRSFLSLIAAITVGIFLYTIGGCGSGSSQSVSNRFAGRWAVSWQDPNHLITLPGTSAPVPESGTIDIVVSSDGSFAGSIFHAFLGFSQVSASLPLQGLFSGNISSTDGILIGTIKEPDSPTIVTVSGDIIMGTGGNSLSGVIHLFNGANSVSTLQVSGSVSAQGAPIRFAGSYTGRFTQFVQDTQSGGAAAEDGTLSVLVKPDGGVSGTAHNTTRNLDGVVSGSLNASGVLLLTLNYPTLEFKFSGIASLGTGSSIHLWLSDLADSTGSGQLIADLTP